MLEVATLLIVLQSTSAAQSPTLEGVLARLDAYLIDYERRLSTVVADEAYEQQYLNSIRGRNSIQKRTLKSDFVFLKLPGESPWLGFRDTFLVDGKMVRDDDARLQRILTDGSDDAVSQARRIAAENARYNLGDFVRTINVPTEVLDLLHPRHRSHFTFRKIGNDTIDGRPLWRIGFREVLKPSLIKTREGADQPASGSVWVDPADGTVVRTVLDLGGDRAVDQAQTKITVEFSADGRLGFRVPTRMTEVYLRPGLSGMRITGQATYTNYRQFQTTVRIVPNQ